MRSFIQAKTTPSDINEHIQTLCDYAKGLHHVTEFGVRSVVSTWAFIEAGVEFIHSYDIHYNPDMKAAREAAEKNGVTMLFYLEDTLDAVIVETDLLFVDTIHTYEQVKGELARHADKVRKYIIFHDVVTYGEVGGILGPIPGTKGIMPAINEFLEGNDNWEVEAFFKNNNGLMIIKRK